MSQTKRIPRWTMLIPCSLMLIVLLTACGGGATANTPTPTSVPPTSTPTPAPTLPPTSAANLTTYMGSGYSIGYPKAQGWTATKSGNGGATFTDPTGLASLTVQVLPDPNSAVPASGLVNIFLQAFKSQAKNYQVVSIAPTTMLAGDTWSQGSATGDVVPKGRTSAVPTEVVVIADTHPAQSVNTKGFAIAYATGQQAFSLANMSFFQPMLQSFQFV